MPVHLNFTVDKVYLRAGVVSQTFAAPGQVRPAKPWDRLNRFGTLLFWPKALDWLKMTAQAAPDPGVAGSPITFSDTVAGLDAVCTTHAVRRDQVAPARFLETYSFLAASLPRDGYSRVVLTVNIDTDADGFRATVKERRLPERSELVQPLQLLFFDAGQFKTFVGQPGQVDLVLKPCVPVPRFPGVLAIDLGNTTTTAASQSEGDPVHRSESVRLVPLEKEGEPGAVDPMPSVIRFDQINTVGELPEGGRRFPAVLADDRPTAVVYAAGRAVVAGAAEGELPPGVVYGAKQLLSVKDVPGEPVGPDGQPPEPYIRLTVSHARPDAPPQAEMIEVLNRIPGELLFTHAVRRFRTGASAWPPDLALTYPTTYSPRELRQLVRAAARGWLRAMGQPQAFDPHAEPNEDEQLEALGAAVREWLQSTDPAVAPSDCPLIGLTLDEATAAAFFHVYRRVFEMPGGLLRFRYLHPEGIRLLLIDCGGGTTDIALVHAVSPPQSPRLLEMDVLARTGVRAFGGDHMTREVCRLVKAKMVMLLKKASNPASVPSTIQAPPLAGPAAADQARSMVETFIARIRELDPRDDVLPTRFDPDKPDGNTPHRRTVAHALWQLGEAIKRRLGEGKPVKVKEIYPDKKLGKDTSPLIAAALQAIKPEAHTQALTQLGDLTVSPWEVDALVRKPIEAAMAKCNRLIRKHLVEHSADNREHEVDWVVLSGNGARYPLVQKLARELLHVAYIEERLNADPGNMKEAVAKGAAMARMVERVPRAAGVKFNRDLSKLLPFDIGFHNMVTNTTEPLFTEYTPYKELAEQSRVVKLERAAGGNPNAAAAFGNTFILERRFPGDDGYTPYAAYTFAQGIQGELEVRYDANRGEFVVTEVTTREEGVFKDLTEGEHHAAAMRGDI